MSGFDWLRCPHCVQPLVRAGQSLRCVAGHTFDLAKQGYVNLLGRAAPANADTPAMLDARARYLASGHFDPIAHAVAAQATGLRVVEVGAGTGFYLGRVLDQHPDAEGLATDVSVAAAKRAARAHARARAVVADTWTGLPIADAAVDTIVCVFAPRNPAEFTRILRPGGRLIVAVPTDAHLRELRQRHGLLDVAPDKANAVVDSLPGWESERTLVEHTATLTATEAGELIGMGPNAFHDVPKISQEAQVTISVEVVTLKPPSGRLAH